MRRDMNINGTCRGQYPQHIHQRFGGDGGWNDKVKGEVQNSDDCLPLSTQHFAVFFDQSTDRQQNLIHHHCTTSTPKTHHILTSHR
jgi:hypothetical protein